MALPKEIRKVDLSKHTSNPNAKGSAYFQGKKLLLELHLFDDEYTIAWPINPSRLSASLAIKYCKAFLEMFRSRASNPGPTYIDLHLLVRPDLTNDPGLTEFGILLPNDHLNEAQEFLERHLRKTSSVYAKLWNQSPSRNRSDLSDFDFFFDGVATSRKMKKEAGISSRFNFFPDNYIAQLIEETTGIISNSSPIRPVLDDIETYFPKT